MKKVIQIGGTVRSGTTLHGLILANRKGALMLGEVMHLFKPLKPSHHAMIAELSKKDKWKIILNGGQQNLYRNIFNVFSETEIIVDSSKDPIWFSKQVKDNPEFAIKQLLVYKSVDDLQRSFQKRESYNMERAFFRYNKKFLSFFPNVRTSFTPDFIGSNSYRNQVQSYLNLSNVDNNLNYWERNQPNFFGSDSVKSNKIEQEINKKPKILTFSDKTFFIENELETRQCIEEEIDHDGFNWGYSQWQLQLVKVYSRMKNSFISMKSN